jgi:hypothetical protein
MQKPSTANSGLGSTAAAHDPDVLQLLHEAEMEDFAEELENAFTAPGSGFYSTMHMNPDGTLTRLWSHRGAGQHSSLPPTN